MNKRSENKRALVSSYLALRKVMGILAILFPLALFFITLAYFSLYLFTRTDQKPPLRPRKLQRNKVYRTSGYVIIVCIVLIAIYQILPDGVASPIKVFRPVFWLEAIAVVAFGFSWLTKGKAISMLNDQRPSPA